MKLDEGSIHPTANGEVRYVAGLGWRFYEEGSEIGLAGSGITEPQHEALDTLTHEITETSYDEVTYSGGNPTSYIVWETAAKLKKVREETYSYVSGKVSQAVTKQYDGTGTLKATLTEDYTYAGSKVTSITRTRS